MFLLTDAGVQKENAWAAFLVPNTEIQQSRPLNTANTTAAEINAIKFALEYVVAQKQKNAVIINDNQGVVGAINGENNIVDVLKEEIQDIQRMMKETSSLVVWMPRKITQRADKLVRKGFSETPYVYGPVETLSLPELNGIEPSLDDTFMQIAKQVGQLSAAIKQGDKARIVEELIDVAQCCVTALIPFKKSCPGLFELCYAHHWNKMRRKKYLI